MKLFQTALLCAAVVVAAAAATPPQLRYVVIVTRHGVRSPTWNAERLNPYAAEPWPHWDVPPGYLTPHGRTLIELMGAYYREWLSSERLLHAQGCADARRVYIHADTDQRTLETGRALAEALLPGCPVAVDAEPGGRKDPLILSNSCHVDAAEPLRERIRFLGEQLDAHRKRQQELHPNLTLTEMYNVLDQLRAGQPLSPATQIIHDRGLVSVLRDLHNDLDRAVAEAYGWPLDLPTEDILFRLVELNSARAAEERAGLVRWLRPEFQATGAMQAGLEVEMEEEEQRPAPLVRLPWPPSLPDRVRAVRDYLTRVHAPAPPGTVARTFTRARLPEITAILETLTALGQARRDASGYRA